MTLATDAVHEESQISRGGLDASRLAGAGGLVFATTLVAQNLIRAKGPALDTAPAKVSDYFLHHHVAALVPLGMFPVGMLGIFAFVAGVWTLAERSEKPWWARVGVLGAAAIAGLFAVVNIIEIVLTAKASQLAPSTDLVQMLWALHAAAFGLDLAAIAIALLGLSRAATALRLVPNWIGVVAVPGAACLLTASVFTVSLTNGGPWLPVALIGFVVWIVFLVLASLSLLRGREMR
jgi:hypothetical protein